MMGSETRQEKESRGVHYCRDIRGYGWTREDSGSLVGESRAYNRVSADLDGRIQSRGVI